MDKPIIYRLRYGPAQKGSQFEQLTMPSAVSARGNWAELMQLLVWRISKYMVVFHNITSLLTFLCSVANATADLIVMGTWSCVLDVVEGEPIPVRGA